MKLLSIILLTGALLATNAIAEPKKKVLIVASNMINMGDPEQHDARNNLWEFAPPYHIFFSHGFEVDFVSPNGGEVKFMLEPLGISSYTIKYEGFLEKANSSFKPAQIDPNDYWGVFIGGGYGVMFDVTDNKQIQSIISSIYESGGILGVGGHGSAGIVNVKLSNGEFLVKGKKIAGFPNSTETSKPWAKQGTLLPFLIENQLNKNGAIAQNKKTLKDKHAVIADQRIISTMFLPSAALVAKEMITLRQ
ncbi:MAG: putative intracellular protease/amidase [Pseudoalteromonas rhizosphaerae]|jgi:putative intracellular protease/amidase|uniref:Type 1 glutamine amidotransferase domain-containing protein n=1 Tax=Pseudoalteromonas neustonica TaxID=1840331 RepID=A0ABY3FFY0_9GAMM|nr:MULTISPECIES: type 1 glutamine amidotransferase domain-containing protein [Pseudoalteromonas]MBB1294194.1 type 1 glutamine amidotransferase domain-containing protein [Pseudoalteromonas sp. SR41-4]MBB1396285.1 type 1 glutamine amidotransferase domain-containing protein [Pseudoalteromonas sp. SG44-8]MBB1408047.1 type 1 glutamine amidotransferase domain-containing protein [Pseudoalteromonas sp. SG44-17]MBB1504412.1 type 1 glutamine amidotransferase domain-containing protein [Pseudoalteromonas s